MHLHPARPPETILSSWSVTQYDQADLERARWVWERRPKRHFLAFWRWLACILAPALAAPFLHLPRPFADILVDVSFVGGCVLVFLYGREEDQSAQWRADYSAAIDRLFFPPDLKQIPLQMDVGETVVSLPHPRAQGRLRRLENDPPVYRLPVR